MNSDVYVPLNIRLQICQLNLPSEVEDDLLADIESVADKVLWIADGTIPRYVHSVAIGQPSVNPKVVHAFTCHFTPSANGMCVRQLDYRRCQDGL